MEEPQWILFKISIKYLHTCKLLKSERKGLQYTFDLKNIIVQN